MCLAMKTLAGMTSSTTCWGRVPHIRPGTLANIKCWCVHDSEDCQHRAIYPTDAMAVVGAHSPGHVDSHFLHRGEADRRQVEPPSGTHEDDHSDSQSI
ncbi:hypothetical protein C8Q74DRAFT_1030342 [Fomes fomentarius]|nr:hypothetical protein C8Q74DRAFT_1030342 [Fomes fomentarius]